MNGRSDRGNKWAFPQRQGYPGLLWRIGFHSGNPLAGSLAEQRSHHGSRFMKRFLVPVDFSESSMQGLRHAMGLARNQNGEIILLHVMDVKLNWPATGPVNTGKLRDEMRAEADKKMQVLVQAISLSGVPVRPLIMEGVPSERITAQAKETEATMIVMGRRRKRSGVHLLRRHNARRVVEDAPCPVLLVPHCASPKGVDGDESE